MKRLAIGNGHPSTGFHITSYRRLKSMDVVFRGYSDEKPSPGDIIETVRCNLYEVVSVASYEPHRRMKTNVFKLTASPISGMPF